MSGFCLYLKACLTVTVANPIHRPVQYRVIASEVVNVVQSPFLSLRPESCSHYCCSVPSTPLSFFLLAILSPWRVSLLFHSIPFFFASTTALCLCTDAVQEESHSGRSHERKPPQSMSDDACISSNIRVIDIFSRPQHFVRYVVLLFCFCIMFRLSGLYLFVPLV